MIFVSMRELRTDSAKLLDKGEEIIITRHGKPAGILAPVSDDFEETLQAIRQAKALHNLAVMRAHAKKKGLDKLTLKDVNRIIDQARHEEKP